MNLNLHIGFIRENKNNFEINFKLTCASQVREWHIVLHWPQINEDWGKPEEDLINIDLTWGQLHISMTLTRDWQGHSKY